MIKDLQSKMTHMLQNKSQISEEIEGKKLQSESLVVDLENKLILMEGDKL